MHLTQNEYTALAKRAIRQYGRQSMLKDDEAIGEIASYIINADIKYNPDKGMTRNSWRMLNGRYGVLVFLAKRRRQKHMVSLEDSPAPFVDELMDGIVVNEIYSLVEKDQSISKREREIFYDRHKDSLSLRQIGRKHNLTHEYIRQILKNTYAKIRVHYESGY